jgi:outer membrane protein TolC
LYRAFPERRHWINLKQLKMKRLILLACLGATVSVHAQTRTPITLSLRQAIDTGLKNRYDVQADQYNIGMAENDISKSKKAWIPDIHAEGNVQYNAQIQPTYVPKGFIGLTEPEMLAFGAKNATVFGLTLDQPVFRPGIRTDVKIAKASLALQKEKVRGNDIGIKNVIATAYLDVLLKDLQYRIALDDEHRFKAYEELAAGKYKDGALIENDYLRAKLDYDNAKVKAATVLQNDALSRAYLKYKINIPPSGKIILSDSIENITFRRAAELPDHAIANRTEIKQLKLQQQENTLQIDRARQNALPSVSLFGYYAQLFQNQTFHYNDSKWWAPHSYVGLKFTIPITGNFTNKNNIRKFELKGRQMRMNMRQEVADVSYQIEQATTDLQNALQNMQSTKTNYALSKKIYKNQQQQFALGVFRYSDLLDTEKSLSNAEQNYIKAVYDYLIAQLQYEKAVGAL